MSPLAEYLASPWTDVDGRQSSHGDSVLALDGIRGLAVLVVLASHTSVFGMTGQGSLGVFLFFTLSGFVLTLPFADRPERIFQPREIWHYFANRFLRIVPAFVVAVLFISWQIAEPWKWVWLNLSFFSGWNHFWSVAEEVRFYFLFPFVIAGLALLPSRPYRIAALFVLLLLAWQFQGFHRVDLMIKDMSVPLYFFFFVAGMLACLTYRALARIDLGHSVDVLAPLAALGVMYFNGWEHPGLWCLMFFLLLFGASNSQKAFTSRLFRSWIMRHLGLLSYSLYLFQVPVMLLMLPLELEGIGLFAATFAATYLVAVVSYLAVEKPFLMLKPKRIKTEIIMA
jgi:peptidoglycan/LPS O-acetylase OafA/YrhL